MEEPDGTINPARSGEIIATGLAPSRPSEAGILMTIAPSAYTVILKGAGDEWLGELLLNQIVQLCTDLSLIETFDDFVEKAGD